MFGNSVVVVVVVRTRPQAIPLAMITMRKSTHGFPFLSHDAYEAPPKRKRRHWKSQNCWAVWIFEWFKPRLNVLKDQQSRELRKIRTSCPTVYLYYNANKYTYIWPWKNEEQNVDKKKKRYYTRIAVLQSLSPWKRKGGKGKKNKLLKHGAFVFGQPSLVVVTLRWTYFLKFLRWEKVSKREKVSETG